MKANRGWLLLAAALLVGGVATAGAGLQTERPSIRPQPDQFLNNDRPATINAHSSPAAAVNPRDSRDVVMADRTDTPRFACSIRRSYDGGNAWRLVALPLAEGAPNCFWPDVAFDGDGNLLVLYTATTGRYNHPAGLWLQRYAGANPDGPATQVTGPIPFHGRLAASGRRVFVVWVHAGPGILEKPLGFAPAPNPLLLSRSDDAGRTFSAPATVSEPERLAVQPDVMVGTEGEVVVGALDMVDDVEDYEGRHEGQEGPPVQGRWRVVTWSSTDDGVRFRPGSVAGELVIPRRVVVDLGPAPSFARDPATGRLYAVWDGGLGDARDVFLARSDDGGVTWSKPTAVLPRPRGQFLPAAAVAPDGRVDVLFYDRSTDPEDIRASATLASSWDGGTSFMAAVVAQKPSDSRIGSGGFQSLGGLGTQLAVVSGADQAVAFWADSRRGNIDNAVLDLAAAIVEVDRGRNARWALVALGAALAAAGCLVAVTLGRRRG